EELWEAHLKAKQDLLDFIHVKTSTQMDINTLTIAYARRATEYKRAAMIFSDIEQLREIQGQGRIQLVFAGKAHPHDEMGKQLIKEIYDCIAQLKNEIDIVY